MTRSRIAVALVLSALAGTSHAADPPSIAGKWTAGALAREITVTQTGEKFVAEWKYTKPYTADDGFGRKVMKTKTYRFKMTGTITDNGGITEETEFFMTDESNPEKSVGKYAARGHLTADSSTIKFLFTKSLVLDKQGVLVVTPPWTRVKEGDKVAPKDGDKTPKTEDQKPK